MKKTWSVQWHITTKCEQRCRHCYIFNSPEGKKEIDGEKIITWSMLKKIADDIKNTSDNFGANCNVAITGGDPLLHQNFWNLLSYLTELGGIKISVMGNPWLITNKVAKNLKMVGVNTFQLSIDGMRQVHDFWRKKGSFDQTIRAVKVLQKNGINVAIMTTVSKSNAHDIPKIIELVSDKLQVAVYAFARYVPTHKDTDEMFTPQEYRQFLDKIWPYYAARIDSKTSFNLKDHLWTLYLYEKGLFKTQDTKNVIVAGCGLGINHMTILADGMVYACRRFYSPLGRVPEKKLVDMFFGSKMEMYRETNFLEKCKKCFLKYYCRGCRAVAYGITGDWRKPDPQCWR